jgi:hypothetical protein
LKYSGDIGIQQKTTAQRAGDMIMFNTMGEEGFRSGLNTMPRLLETTDDRVKFIAAVRSPVARDVLNFDVRARKIII